MPLPDLGAHVLTLPFPAGAPDNRPDECIGVYGQSKRVPKAVAYQTADGVCYKMGDIRYVYAPLQCLTRPNGREDGWKRVQRTGCGLLESCLGRAGEGPGGAWGVPGALEDRPRPSPTGRQDGCNASRACGRFLVPVVCPLW